MTLLLGLVLGLFLGCTLFAVALCKAASELQAYDDARSRARIVPMKGMWRER